MTTEFFRVQTVQAALAQLFATCEIGPHAERCATIQAIGRVIAYAPRSPIDLPTFRRSTMDGYAVRAADTYGATASLPAYLLTVGTIPMGTAPAFTLGLGEAVEIFTGAMLPDGADAVVMIEKTQRIDDSQIEVLASVAVGENVVQIGEDVRAGAEILPIGHRIRPHDIGGLLALGMMEVEVAASPRIAILGSGDELISPEAVPTLGQIRDTNSYTLAALFEQSGAITQRVGIAPDRFEDLLGLAQAGLAKSDMLVITAGSSVSSRDLTRAVIEQLGKPGILQHGLAVKPGKPTLIAVCGGKIVIGLPGNPVSAFLVARQLILPIIQRFLGQKSTAPKVISATLTANIASQSGSEDTIPVRLFQGEAGWQAEPIFGKSNLIFTLLQADGVVTIALNSGGVKAGTQVEVSLF